MQIEQPTTLSDDYPKLLQELEKQYTFEKEMHIKETRVTDTK
jgi:hypothetical protein